jgi:hypothetical protein
VTLKAAYLDHYDNPLKHTFEEQTIRGIDQPVQVNFGGQINLIGYDLNRPQLTAGQSFRLTAYWQARRPAATNYSSLAQLVDEEQHLYAGQDNLHPGLMPTSQWPTWGFVRDPHMIRVPAGTPPGRYFLVTGLYDPHTWARLPLMDGGDPTWTDVVAIPVTIHKPATPPVLTELDIAWPVEADFGPELRLLGTTPERPIIMRNDFLRLAVFWEAKRSPSQDYQIRLRLLASGGEVAIQETTQPSHRRYPTTLWQAGERVRDNHALWIPVDFPADTYQIQLQVVEQRGQPTGPWIELGTMAVAK